MLGLVCYIYLWPAQACTLVTVMLLDPLSGPNLRTELRYQGLGWEEASKQLGNNIAVVTLVAAYLVCLPLHLVTALCDYTTI